MNWRWARNRLPETHQGFKRSSRPALLIGWLAISAAASAQTVRPVIVEYSGHASGKFELVNNSLTPVNVVLEPKSFAITEHGQGVYRPLESTIHVKLSAMSFRIPPLQSRFVFYEATADQLPAWFVIYSLFSGLPAQEGINIQVLLPHTVYLVQKMSLTKPDLHLEAQYAMRLNQVIITLDNIGPNLGRVLTWQLISKHGKKVFPGFPLLPYSRRQLQSDWDASTPPEYILLQFQHFSLREPLRPISSPEAEQSGSSDVSTAIQ